MPIARPASWFQSTPPRGLGDPLGAAHVGDRVSIHAPRVGATSEAASRRDAIGEVVSIHAPAWGATYVLQRPPSG